MEFQDRTLKCRDCGKDFVFTAGEQAFYQQKNFENDPVRCGDCRQSRKKGSAGGRGAAELYDVVCAECSSPTQVPFIPRQGRPVYCRACLDSKNRAVV
ncbi:MAG: zinc-ribbon domain containing protein [Candidatus Xenobia bacterium]